jgi:hypothetical protein
MNIPGFNAEASAYRTRNFYYGGYGVPVGDAPAGEHDRIDGTPLPAAFFPAIQPAGNVMLPLQGELMIGGFTTTLARPTAAAARPVNCNSFCAFAYAFCPGQRQNCINICNRQCAPRGLEPCVVGSGPCPVTRCKCGERCCELGDVCCGRSAADSASGKCCPEDRCCRSLVHPDGECCGPDVKCTTADGCCKAGRIPCGRVGDVFRECCPWGKICRDGQCACPADRTPCAGECCEPGEYCEPFSEVCTPCPAGSTPCGYGCCSSDTRCHEGRLCCWLDWGYCGAAPGGYPGCCPPGESVCCPAEGPHEFSYCCQDGTTCCRQGSDCCTPDEDCMEGGCRLRR